MSEYPPITDLVPHGEPMLMLEEMVAWEPGVAECRMTVRQHGPFVVEGQVDSVVTLEIMAQAVAACLGYEAFIGGEGVRVGMIVGCRSMELARAAIPVGAQLRVHARRLRGNETVSNFVCEVVDGDGPIASAQMTLFHADAPPE